MELIGEITKRDNDLVKLFDHKHSRPLTITNSRGMKMTASQLRIASLITEHLKENFLAVIKISPNLRRTGLSTALEFLAEINKNALLLSSHSRSPLLFQEGALLRSSTAARGRGRRDTLLIIDALPLDQLKENLPFVVFEDRKRVIATTNFNDLIASTSEDVEVIKRLNEKIQDELIKSLQNRNRYR